MSDEDVVTFAVNRHLFPSVDTVADSSGWYPNKNLAAHAVDYVGRINERELSELHPKKIITAPAIGKLGIEKYYEHLLHDKAGFQHVEINAQGRHL